MSGMTQAEITGMNTDRITTRSNIMQTRERNVTAVTTSQANCQTFLFLWDQISKAGNLENNFSCVIPPYN